MHIKIGALYNRIVLSQAEDVSFASFESLLMSLLQPESIDALASMNK